MMSCKFYYLTAHHSVMMVYSTTEICLLFSTGCRTEAQIKKCTLVTQVIVTFVLSFVMQRCISISYLIIQGAHYKTS